MPIKVLMPSLSPTMTDGNLAKWLKKEGDLIEPGDVIAEIETDKATMEVEASESGVLGKIIVAENTENVKVGTVIAVLLENGETKESLIEFEIGGKTPASSKLKDSAESDDVSSLDDKVNYSNAIHCAGDAYFADISSSSSASDNFALDSIGGSEGQKNVKCGRVFASPLAKRLAQNMSINLLDVQASGPHGRIVKSDIEKFLKNNDKGSSINFVNACGDSRFIKSSNEENVVKAPSQTNQSFEYGSYNVVKASNIRKIIAKKLSESKQNIPHFYLSTSCNMRSLLEIRNSINSQLSHMIEVQKVSKISVNDFIVKAVSLSLAQMPILNSSWNDGEIFMYNNVDISVAVSIDDGLITPIVRSADKKSIFEISGEIKTLANKARNGKLLPEEFLGGGFSVSNLGMYDVEEFKGIINPPQSAILAVGKVINDVVAINEVVTVAPIMKMSLSCDHRVIDGVVAAKFIGILKKYIENPVLIIANVISD